MACLEKEEQDNNGDEHMPFPRKKDPKSILSVGSQYLCIFAEQITYKGLAERDSI